MLIGDKFKIESVPMNIVLYEKGKPRKNKESWRAIGYFSTPQNALKFLADYKVLGSGMKDFQTVVKVQEEIYQLINKLELSSEAL